MKVAILDDYQNVVKDLDCFKLLKGHDICVFNEAPENEHELVNKLQDFEALILIRERTVITEGILSKLPNLRLISQTGKRSNHLDIDLCRKYGVAVAEGIGSPIAPSELCWALIMAASRHLPAYVETLRNEHWQQNGGLGLGRSLNGLLLGIWGYGKIGRRIAQYARAFDMQVVIWGSEASREQAKLDGFQAAISKEDFFSKVDILTLHLRLNNATKNCVKQSDLTLMKSDSLFVNTSRSGLVEPGALYLEMQSNPTKRAAVDVYSQEPATKAEEPLLSLPNVLCSPHLGYVEKNSYELYFRAAFENLIFFARGTPRNLA